MRNVLALTILTLTCFVMVATAHAEAGEETATTQVGMGEAAASYTDSALDAVFAAEDNVNAQIDAYLASDTGQALQASGAWIGRAYTSVGKSTSAADWGKLRVAAYNTAWSQVQQEFVRYQYNDGRSEVIRKFFNDASNGAPEYVRDTYTGNETIDEFIDKSGVYLTSQLDGALREFGVDPDTYNRASNKQRKDLLVDSIRRETVAQSIGKLSGLWSVKSFSGVVDGYQAIGVIGLYRPEFSELAGEIAGRRQVLSNGASSSPLAKRIPKDPAQLVNAFGVRVLRDENGYPVLLGFGQWSVSDKDPNPVIMSRLRTAALSQARSVADTELQQFINGTSNYTDKVIADVVIRKYVDVDREGYVESGDSVEVTDIVDELLTTRAYAKLSGQRDFTTWTYRHPNTGHMMVGVVRMWSPVESAKAMAITAGRASAAPQEQAVQTTGETEGKSSSWTEESPDIGDPNDF